MLLRACSWRTCASFLPKLKFIQLCRSQWNFVAKHKLGRIYNEQRKGNTLAWRNQSCSTHKSSDYKVSYYTCPAFYNKFTGARRTSRRGNINAPNYTTSSMHKHFIAVLHSCSDLDTLGTKVFPDYRLQHSLPPNRGFFLPLAERGCRNRYRHKRLTKSKTAKIIQPNNRAHITKSKLTRECTRTQV